MTNNTATEILVRELKQMADNQVAEDALITVATKDEALSALVEVENAIWSATGSALLAGEKCSKDDAGIIYRSLCEAGNKVAWAHDQLSARLSATLTPKRAVTHSMYEAGMRYLRGRGTAWCCTDLYLAMEDQRVEDEAK